MLPHSSVDSASQHSLYFYYSPNFVLPSMRVPLTSCITLATTSAAVGLIPSAGRPPMGESICHSRLMLFSLTDQLPLVWNLSVPQRGSEREVMLFQLIATQVVQPCETVIHTFNLCDSVTVK